MAVILLLIAGGLGVVLLTMGNDSKPKDCVDVAVDASDRDVAPDEALKDFLGNLPDNSPVPLDGWVAASTTGDTATFANDVHGHWTAEVSRGRVRHYRGCDA